MNAYAINDGPMHLNQYRCSECGDNIRTDKMTPLKFCSSCGVKFGPAPKAEPTVGEWKYSEDCKTVYSTALGVVASVTTEKKEDGHLLAASKKLLAALRYLVSVQSINYLRKQHPDPLKQAEEAIAAAEGK